jgi:hypothetical protein
MTKETEFTQQNSERAMQAASLGMNWARELTEQSINQNRLLLDGMFKVTRKMSEEFEDQASAIRQHSISLTAKTLSNALDFGQKLTRLKEPQELAELQSEFISRQSQAFADHTKELGQKIRSGTEKMANTATAATARPSRVA